MLKLVWLVPVLPLVGVAINGIFGRLVRDRAHILGVGTTGLSFLIGFAIFLRVAGGQTLNCCSSRPCSRACAPASRSRGSPAP